MITWRLEEEQNPFDFEIEVGEIFDSMRTGFMQILREFGWRLVPKAPSTDKRYIRYGRGDKR